LTNDVSEPRYAWLQDAVDAGKEIVTANRRLARTLAIAYGEQQVAAGRLAWPTPSILYWRDWLSKTLAAASNPADVPRRIDHFSASVLWERCLRKRMPETVLSFGGIVRQSGQAWQRLGDWRVPTASVLASARTRDERLFAGAAADYQDLLDENNWVDNPGLAAAVEKLLQTDRSVVPAGVMLAGFDQLSPAVEGIIASLEAAGCQTVVRAASESRASVSVAAFDQQSSELRAAGAWARNWLDVSPDARIAIVVPALEANAVEIGRLVREGLAPGWQYGSDEFRGVVNVSYGQRLSAYPAVAVALLLLRWSTEGLSGRELSILLRSLCTGHEDSGDNARLERDLRSKPDREWIVDNFLAAFAGKEDPEKSRSFLQISTKIADFGRAGDERFTPADCVRHIDELLRDVGWPGEAPLDSAGFQLVNRWRELLNEFARVSAVMPELSLAEAISRVSSLATETVWQPEADTGRVEVMGFLEAAGLEFDYLWVGGMDATQWPPPSRPAPFLSLALQRELEMPDATPGATLEFSRRVLERLMRSAGVCVLSWSRMKDDAELTASALVDQIEADHYDGPEDPGWSVAGMAGRTEFEVIGDDPAPVVGNNEHVGGGAYTVQRQFSEPFSAFVAGRLGVRPLDPFWTGLSPGVRGNIIHNALHNLLAERPSQQQLIAWTSDEIKRRVGSAIDAALAPHLHDASDVIRRIIGIERDRLRNLLIDFIGAESERAAFTVMDVEKKVDFEAFGVSLGFRVDRIDRLADGRLLVIDYKTGQPKSFIKQSGELKDVQLVVYADALKAEIGGLVFINVDSRKVDYRAVGGGWNDAEEDTWDEVLRGWTAEVHEAIKSLAAGDIRINIRQSVTDSRALGILSRLEEQKRDG
jgi:probable DNA repair protein